MLKLWQNYFRTLPKMYTLGFLMLPALAILGTCAAYYGDGYAGRNLIVREEPQDDEGELVECPVCTNARNGEWVQSNEICPIVRGNKRYKRCQRGTTMYCIICGIVDEDYDENSIAFHVNSPKHICNEILAEYCHNKKAFSKNREGIHIFTDAEMLIEKNLKLITKSTDKHKIRIVVKPNIMVKFSFTISNDTRNDDMLVVGFQLAHPQPQFSMNDHPYIFGQDPHVLEKS
ncbi:unnamed protein product [Diatraea saccharalis]|uniref:Uncharacterized protein n=1 Tax=Diatraea saccharalis TaxID=40085 RepID=A0A9N9WFV6_9NEOP|nr:unnamed protein product [Diatraea saccharalis]